MLNAKLKRILAFNIVLNDNDRIKVFKGVSGPENQNLMCKAIDDLFMVFRVYDLLAAVEAVVT